jgi:hypothetical protein
MLRVKMSKRYLLRFNQRCGLFASTEFTCYEFILVSFLKLSYFLQSHFSVSMILSTTSWMY